MHKSMLIVVDVTWFIKPQTYHFYYLPLFVYLKDSSSESLESPCPAEFPSSGLSRGGVSLSDNILEGSLIEGAHGRSS